MSLASLGTDTRASIRVPAALSGTVGLPPATFDGAEPGVRGCLDAAIAHLAMAGCWVAPADRPDASDLDLGSAAGLVVSRAEAAAAHRSPALDRAK
jgi:Asp-tRNA(Asn)/Glu-tRNA(Gln) amidotransferase A subunit family amidase